MIRIIRIKEKRNRFDYFGLLKISVQDVECFNKNYHFSNKKDI